MRRKVAFVTIGQTPRTDLVPEMLNAIGPGIDAVEVGALDGLDQAEIGRLAPEGAAHRLVTRLADGSEAVIDKAWTRGRLQEIYNTLDQQDFDLIVLLCTGYFERLDARTLVVESQSVVDHTVAALSEGARSIGVMVPLEKQIREVHYRIEGGRSLLMSYASPYSEDRIEAAGRELAPADLIVMHCIGYSEAMRRRVARASGRPVILARRAVANAVAQLV